MCFCGAGCEMGANTKSLDMRPDNLIGDTKDNMAELACDGQIACCLKVFLCKVVSTIALKARPLVLFTPYFHSYWAVVSELCFKTRTSWWYCCSFYLTTNTINIINAIGDI